MPDNKDITENPAVLAGAATFVAAGAAQVGLPAAALGVATVGKAGLILASFGPVGLVIGGGLMIGGLIYVAANNRKKK